VTHSDLLTHLTRDPLTHCHLCDGVTVRRAARASLHWRHLTHHTTQLSVGCVDPWVGSRFFSFRWVGLIAFSALTLFVGRQEAVGCWRGYLSGTYSPADATATQGLLLQLNPDWFNLSGTGHTGSPGHRAVKRVCVGWVYCSRSSKHFENITLMHLKQG